MQLTLFIPGLLLPGEVLADTVFDLTAPSLSLILGRGQRQVLDPEWLPRAFGVGGPLPAAALRKVGVGRTATGAWICLDPVHWRVSREGITLADPVELGLSEKEATAMLTAVQPLFAEWGELSASTPLHWELHLTRSLLLETRPLADCIGLPVDPSLPGGLDGQEWRRLLAEAQTILHAHPLNRQREMLGKPVVNSLWPWGLGSLPENMQTRFTVAWSKDPVVAGLCAQPGIPCLASPGHFHPASGAVLCHLDVLSAPARALDALTWRAALLNLEQNWLLPAVMALKKGECSALRIVGTSLRGTPQTTMYSLVRGNLWRFWRRPLPLTELR